MPECSLPFLTTCVSLPICKGYVRRRLPKWLMPFWLKTVDRGSFKISQLSLPLFSLATSGHVVVRPRCRCRRCPGF